MHWTATQWFLLFGVSGEWIFNQCIPDNDIPQGGQPTTPVDSPNTRAFVASFSLSLFFLIRRQSIGFNVYIRIKVRACPWLKFTIYSPPSFLCPQHQRLFFFFLMYKHTLQFVASWRRPLGRNVTNFICIFFSLNIFFYQSWKAWGWKKDVIIIAREWVWLKM